MRTRTDLNNVVVRIPTPIESVRPICLPVTASLAVSKRVTIAGWGLTERSECIRVEEYTNINRDLSSGTSWCDFMIPPYAPV